jgi:NDP-sugar pyrophosphorylase family protein
VIDALVFAAGLGTRLRPVTDTIPKALVTVGGLTILERAIRRLLSLDPGLIVVNAHHHAEQIEAAIEALSRDFASEAAGSHDSEAKSGSNTRIVVSVEKDRPLETGGGLRHAGHLFQSGSPILLHNGDVITDLDLKTLVSAHADYTRNEGTVATLAVQERVSSRELLFDEAGLYGRRHVTSGREEVARDVFSITDHYLALAAQGVRIRPFEMETAGWWEIGTPERLAAARLALGEREVGS